MRAPLALVVAIAFGIDVPPHQYGRVELRSRAQAAGVPAVNFDHSSHRVRFTCRLCHVDVGFAMQKGATGISSATNSKGFHCGACHNGATLFEGKPIFAACSASRDSELPAACRRCHGASDEASRRADAALQLPRGMFGEVDFERAEGLWKIHPLDAVEGLSLPRPALKMDRDISIVSMASWMTDVRFSHKKHAVWNGCEVCHPDIFPSTKAGARTFTMFQVSAGEACGACHGKVAFALAYCGKCHTRPVGFQ
jgi:c(7)-type cytochrome triheme protein